MKQTIVAENTPIARAVNNLSRDVTQAIAQLGRSFSKTYNALSVENIATANTIAYVAVPMPIGGYSIEVLGWCNAYWSGGVLSARVTLEYGDRILASAIMLSSATTGFVCPYLQGELNPTGDSTFRIKLEAIAGVTVLSVMSRGLSAHYVERE